MADILALKELAERNPSALSPDGWKRLADAPGVDLALKGVSYPAEMLGAEGDWLRHPSGYLVTGPGSADIIRNANGGGGSTGSSALDLCLRRYGRFYNMPPLRLWEGPRGDVEASEAVEKDAVYALLSDPHEDLTLRELRGLVARSKFVDGNAYQVKLRTGAGTILDNVHGMVQQLHPVDPTRMRPARDKDSKKLIDFYALDLGNGYSARVPKENVIHFRDAELDPRDPAKGLGVVRRLVREVATDAEEDAFVASFMRNMGIPGLVFAPKEQSKGQVIDVEQLQSYVAASTTGENRGKPLVFKTPVDFYQMSASTQVLDLSHVSARVETRIAGMVGIPAILAGLAAGLDATSYGANTRALVESFIENELMSAWDEDGERWTIALRADFGFSPTQWLGYDWTGLRALQDDEDAKVKRYTAMWVTNAITLEQYHQALDMDLPPGADPNARAADFHTGGGSPTLGVDVEGGVVPVLPAGAEAAAGDALAAEISAMSAAKIGELRQYAADVLAGLVDRAAAIAQIQYTFNVSAALAAAFVGPDSGGDTIDAKPAPRQLPPPFVEDAAPAKAMPPFVVKAEGWKPPGGGGSLTGDDLTLSPEGVEKLADEAVDDWREWLGEGDDSDLADMLDTTPADHGREKKRGGKASLDWMAKARDRKWAWDPKAQRYRWPRTGRLLPPARVANVRERRVAEAKARMQQAAQSMLDGKLTVNQWQTAMRDESARAHLELRMLGVGGKANMTRGDYQWVHDRVKREAGYLADFGKAVRAGELGEAGILDRSGKYGGASMRDAFFEGATDAHRAAGFTRRRRLGPNDERTCDGCRKEIARDWVGIDAKYRAIGDCECQSQCRCDEEWDKG